MQRFRLNHQRRRGGWGDPPPPWEGKIKRKTQATRGKLCENGKINRKNKKNYKNDQKRDRKYRIFANNINNFKKIPLNL